MRSNREELVSATSVKLLDFLGDTGLSPFESLAALRRATDLMVCYQTIKWQSEISAAQMAEITK